MKSIVNSNYWNEHWRNDSLCIAASHHPIRQWIEDEIPTTDNADVFEIGCYPGKFLAVFGRMGYGLNGIDLFPKTNSVMAEWLKDEGYKIGRFYQSDFLNFSSEQRYDIVCSFGFIEHFKNWSEVLAQHISLAKKRGCIMIDVPNLKSPLYYLLYKIFEPEVLQNHEFSAMTKTAIEDTFNKSGCNIRTSTYLGNFYFRFVIRQDQSTIIIEKFINFLKPFFELLPKSVYARYIAISATKISEDS